MEDLKPLVVWGLLNIISLLHLQFYKLCLKLFFFVLFLLMLLIPFDLVQPQLIFFQIYFFILHNNSRMSLKLSIKFPVFSGL